MTKTKYYMEVICCGCKTSMGRKEVGTKKETKLVSHGICRDCCIDLYGYDPEVKATQHINTVDR